MVPRNSKYFLCSVVLFLLLLHTEAKYLLFCRTLSKPCEDQCLRSLCLQGTLAKKKVISFR